MIQFRSVTKTYAGGTSALRGIDLTIAEGKLTVFVGPSGCGKTTSLRMINRMVEPTSGTITIDGVDVRDINAAELRRGVGYVIQNVGLFPHRTVIDNIATVPLLKGMRRRAARAIASGLLERVGLPATVGSRYPAQLSGGQQQRVGVARALAADPPILLMDEPFSAVDPVIRAQLQDQLLQLQADLGKTVVFVTHDVDEALRLGDRIVVFAPGGRIAQAAEPATLLAAPADDFVADFIGHDRGYRALSFAAAGSLPLEATSTASFERIWALVQGGGEGESAAVSRYDDVPGEAPDRHRWVLLLDRESRPQGWLDQDCLESGRRPERADIRLGGTLIGPGASLRSALDAALSSPSGHGVAVDADGAYLGTVAPGAVLDAIERSRLAATIRAGGPVVGYASSAAEGLQEPSPGP